MRPSVAALVGLALLGVALVLARARGGSPAAIGQGWGYHRVPHFVGRMAAARPIDAAAVPQHPFMAPNGANNMHNDSYVTDTHRVSGPLGRAPMEIVSAALGWLGGECASVTFDRRGRIVTTCMRFAGPRLLLLDPHTLAELASYELPQRASTRSWNLRKIVTDTSGGAYFYLDEQDRAVLATSAHRIEVVAHTDGPEGPRFHLDRSYDLRAVVVRPGHADDTITTALPDWTGRYWFVTRQGLVGTVAADGALRTLSLEGEEIQNSFAVDEQGVFIVSDHAMYGFRADPATGAPVVGWREVYDRGARRKPGMIDQGSGTTPTLLGPDLVAIADNAEPRMNVLVYRRRFDATGPRLVCRQPVFAPGRSATENTLVGVGRSVVVENNYGYDLFLTMAFGRTSAAGVTRVDVDEGGGCHVVWESPEISQTTVPKLSLGNGLLYLYTKAPDAPRWVDAYYLTAVDFHTGATVYKVLAGTGFGYDNNWAPITLGPDGTAYVGALRGLIAIRDSQSVQ